MKHLCITYHMTKPGETAETCITIPMKDEIANDILEHQGSSKHVCESFSITPVKTILKELAELQGYQEAGFCCAEHDKFWKELGY